jgi:hypothetical protein
LKLCHAYIFFFLLSGYLLAQEKKSPVAKFSFNNGKDYDEVSRQKAKLVEVNFVEDRFGNAKSAVYFRGNENSYVNLGKAPALKPRNGSISLWVKIELEVYAGCGGTVNPIIITKCADREDFNEAYVIYYTLESKRIRAGASRDSLMQIGLYSINVFPRLVWHHLVLSFNDDLFSFYLDGKREGTVTKNYETNYNPRDSVILGVTANKKNDRYFNGMIDDVEFYNRVLSDEEVKALYEAPNPNKDRILLNWILLLVAILLMITFIYFFIRYRLSVTLKKEKQRLELYNIVLETELRVNRALMNPHFVFNSLNALQNFILKDENERANNYLVKFAKLMRKILESNTSDVISLEFEIELLNRYLEIEDLRFEENIQHSIVFAPGIIPSTIHIPIMMLQPFIENAIWHGLLKKHDEKILTISFSIFKDKYLQCIIEDNGIGRKNARQDFLEKKSLSTGFVIQRLELLNRIHGLECSLTIEDKPDTTGTMVKIILPILKN